MIPEVARDKSIGQLRGWLSKKARPSDCADHYQKGLSLRPPASLRCLNLPVIQVTHFTGWPAEQAHSFELHRLLTWMSTFLALLRDHRDLLETLETLRCGTAAESGSPDDNNNNNNNDNNHHLSQGHHEGHLKRLVRYRIDEALALVQGAIAMDVTINAQQAGHRIHYLALDDAHEPLPELLSKLCARLFTLSPVRLLAKLSHYSTCLLLTLLVDLLHESGLDARLVQLLVKDHHSPKLSGADQLGSPSSRLPDARPHHRPPPSISICFDHCNTKLASRSIIRAYLRGSHCPNLIVLVEESIYFQFMVDWQNQFERLVGNNEGLHSIQVELNAIDINLALRMSGKSISVIRFRSNDELSQLMRKSLRKITHIQIWSADPMMARQLCLAGQHLNHCNEFWINHLPDSLAARQFKKHLLSFLRESMKEHMNEVYTKVLEDYQSQLDKLLKAQKSFFRRKSASMRTQQVICAYLGLITRFRSLKQLNLSINESVARMKRFQLNCIHHYHEIQGESRVERLLKPVGLAILVVRNKACIKSKAALVEFIFKNLLIGNAVFLVCPQALLGSRFPMNLIEAFELPFQLVNLKPSEEILVVQQAVASEAQEVFDTCDQTFAMRSPDTQVSENNGSAIMYGKQLKCPNNAYAIELRHRELSSDKVESMVLALGAYERAVWFPPEGLTIDQQAIRENSSSEGDDM